MQGLSDEWIENRILRTLKKRGLPNESYPEVVVFVDSKHHPILDALGQMGASSVVGKPIVGFVRSSDCFTVVGSDAVFGAFDTTQVQIPNDDIADVHIVGATTLLPTSCEWLDVVRHSGPTCRLWGPRGEPCLALCAVLLTLIRLQRSGPASL